jgi:hypothetical protein
MYIFSYAVLIDRSVDKEDTLSRAIPIKLHKNTHNAEMMIIFPYGVLSITQGWKLLPKTLMFANLASWCGKLKSTRHSSRRFRRTA